MNQSQLAADTVKNYYGFFDSDRDKLANFFLANSRMTLEGKEYDGVNIVPFIKQFPKTIHKPKYFSIQNSPTPGCFHAFVLGEVFKPDNTSSIFADYFHLAPNSGSYYIANHICRSIPNQN